MPSFDRQMMEQAPAVRAYALMLSASPSEADDLLQDTLEKAWRARGQFEPGTNLRAWMFTILRNTHFNAIRRSRRTVEDIDGARAARLSVEPSQGWRLEYAEVLSAIQDLAPDARHALLLIAAGLSYEEAAQVCDCPLRTLQSRVRRARERLALRLMSDEARPDRTLLT